jgi:hypothetical protein
MFDLILKSEIKMVTENAGEIRLQKFIAQLRHDISELKFELENPDPRIQMAQGRSEYLVNKLDQQIAGWSRNKAEERRLAAKYVQHVQRGILNVEEMVNAIRQNEPLADLIFKWIWVEVVADQGDMLTEGQG